MSRIAALDPETTLGESRPIFDAIHRKLGMVPMMMRVMGNSPAVLNAYLSFSEALAKNVIGSKLTELIALTVVNKNSCEYCTTAHVFIASHILKLDHEIIALALEGRASSKKLQSALSFVTELVEKNGNVSDQTIQNMRLEGFTDSDIIEISACTALNMFTNIINNISKPEIDFPKIILQYQ